MSKYFIMPDDRGAKGRTDEFTEDAKTFGIEFNTDDRFGIYKHVSGCVVCREFRNEVRAARSAQAERERAFVEESASIMNEFAAKRWQAVDNRHPVEDAKSLSPLDVGSLDAMERITCALNLAHGEFATRALVERRNALIAELLG